MQESAQFPLALQQEPLWLYDRTHPGSTVNNCLLIIHVEGLLDPEAFERALEMLVRGHPPLRTRYARRLVSGVPSFSVRAAARVPLLRHDFANYPPHEQERLLEGMESRMLGDAFDLENDLLIRAEWAALTPSRAVVYLCLHHLVYDGYSDRVILRDLALCYHESPAALLCRENRYVDLALQQHGSQTRTRREAALNYWAERLEQPGEPVCLPYDFSKAAAKGCPAGVHAILATESQWRSIVAWAKESGFSPASFLFSCLLVCLYQLGRQPQIQLGVNVAGRRDSGQENWVGLLMSILPVRVAMDDSLPVLEFCRRVRRQLVESMEHREYSFADLLKRIPVSRGKDPFFEVIFNYQEIGPEVQTGADFKMWRGDTQIREVDADLVLNVMPSNEGRLIRFFYNQELFHPDTVLRFSGRFWHILHEMMKRPGDRLRDLALLPAEERRSLLRLSQGLERAEYLQQRLHDLFLQGLPVAARTVALRDHLGPVTYAELRVQASQVASMLRIHGFDRSKPVGTLLPRGRGFVAAILGILMAGGAYLPVDVSEPAIRCREMLEDGDVEVVICESKFPAGEAALMGRKVICLPDVFASVSEMKPGEAGTESAPGDLAYVVFTSGSAGHVKGVLGHHRGAVNYIMGMTEITGVNEGDRILHFSGVNYDGAIEEIFLALAAKATLIVPPAALMESFSRFDQFLRSERITFLSLPASFWQRWLAYLDSGGKPVPPSLRVMLVGFEKVQASGYALWQKISQGRVLFINGYGPTEAGIYSTAFVSGDSPGACKRLHEVPIGRPLPNEQVYLLNEHQELVPWGGTGELYIGGAGVALGYAGGHGTGDGIFVADTFSSQSAARLYRTGDLGRWNHEGLLEIHGRRDQQVKIRGFRVELAGVEAAILEHPKVQETVVCLKKEESGDRMVAYLVGDATRGELVAYLSARLPSHMIPSSFVTLATLPRRSNGKVDRVAVTSLEVDDSAGILHVAPRNILEKKLAAIWKKELGKEPAGVYDSFFEAGGDSVSALGFLFGLEEEFEVHFPVHVLFDRPTIAQLAEALHLATHCPRAAGSPEWYGEEASQHLVALHPPGTMQLERPPLFVIPGGWGGENEMLVFAGLVSRMKRNQHVFGLNARLMSASYTPPQAIPAKAAKYLEAIRKIHPHGPYRIVGECLGGAVALEMAFQIEKSGGTVDRLIVLDYVPLEKRPGNPEDEEILEALELWLGAQPPQVEAYLRELRKYRWPSLQTRVCAIFSEEMGNRLGGLIEEWKALAGDRLTVRMVPGSHESYLRQDAHWLAEMMEEILEAG